MTFHVGQKVVCVDASMAAYLNQGAIYTVLSIDDRFLEVDCEPDALNGRAYYRRRFRPVVERKTDISIFTQMLNPSNQGVDA